MMPLANVVDEGLPTAAAKVQIERGRGNLGRTTSRSCDELDKGDEDD
jgi:hypothetical protein